jgi:hypothetical protein
MRHRRQKRYTELFENSQTGMQASKLQIHEFTHTDSFRRMTCSIRNVSCLLSRVVNCLTLERTVATVNACFDDCNERTLRLLSSRFYTALDTTLGAAMGSG